MLKLSDQPFIYYPPKYHPLLTPIGRLYNKFVYISNAEHRLTSVTNYQTEKIKELKKDRRNHLLFIYNHPSHSDSQIVLESLRQIGISTLYLASYDLFFRRTAFEKWAMQLAGAFSVDREAFNAQPMNQAVSTLCNTRHALTIFAEGRPYLQNELVTNFQSGAVFIGLQAQRKIFKKRKNERVFMVPAAIKVTHSVDCRSKVLDMLETLSRELEVDSRDVYDSISLLEKTGMALMQRALMSRGYGKVEGVDFPGLQEESAEKIIISLEKEIGLDSKGEISLWSRTQLIRKYIHNIMLDPEKNRAILLKAKRWADHVLIAMRILSYPYGYVRDNPTLDRFGETVERLLEDKLNHAIPPYSRRAALVKYGVPVDLSEYVQDGKIKPGDVENITAQSRDNVQKLVDELRKDSPYPGTKLYIKTKSS